MPDPLFPQTVQIEEAKEVGQGEIIINMESMIKQHIQTINTVTEELKKHKSMLDDIFTNDPTYKSHNESVKDATKIRTATKNQILKQPQAADLNLKVKSMRGELKELKSGLSDYLLEYQRMTQATQLELFDGEVVDIIKVAKIVKHANL